MDTTPLDSTITPTTPIDNPTPQTSQTTNETTAPNNTTENEEDLIDLAPKFPQLAEEHANFEQFEEQNTEVFVIPCGDEELQEDEKDENNDEFETTSIGRMDREPVTSSSSSSDDDNDSELSNLSTDNSDSDEDPLNLFSNQDMLNLVADMMAGADDEEEFITEDNFFTKNEISDEYIKINRVDNLPLPPQSYLDQLLPNQPHIAGLQPLGTIMNIFSHKVILRPWGAKSSIFTDSSDDDDDDDHNFGFFQNTHTKTQPPKENAGGTIIGTDELASLTTLQLQTPIFNMKGEGIGRLSDIIGHVEFPFFVVSFHNEVITEGPDQGSIINDKDIQNQVKDKDKQEQHIIGPKTKKGEPKIKKPTQKVTYFPIPKLSNNQILYYLPSMTTSVPTQALIGHATDASNLHDEEIMGHEADFSDDEAESRYRKEQKLAKKNKNQNSNNNPKASQPNPNNRFQKNNHQVQNTILDLSTASNSVPPPPPPPPPSLSSQSHQLPQQQYYNMPPHHQQHQQHQQYPPQNFYPPHQPQQPYYPQPPYPFQQGYPPQHPQQQPGMYYPPQQYPQGAYGVPTNPYGQQIPQNPYGQPPPMGFYPPNQQQMDPQQQQIQQQMAMYYSKPPM